MLANFITSQDSKNKILNIGWDKYWKKQSSLFGRAMAIALVGNESIII
jgi:hypothetical protein